MVLNCSRPFSSRDLVETVGGKMTSLKGNDWKENEKRSFQTILSLVGGGTSSSSMTETPLETPAHLR